MIRFRHSGNFNNIERLFSRNQKKNYLDVLNLYGLLGVQALASATPKDTGRTANAWNYEIVQTDRGYSIFWTNSNFNKGVSIAVILQYGHGTGTGGYVEGTDYINPAIRPIFDEIAKNAWKEVSSK